MSQQRAGRVSIDGQRLANELKKRNLIPKDVSISMGYAEGYISNCISDRSISKPAVMLLDKLYNIPYDDYDVRQPPQTIEVVTPSYPEDSIVNLNAEEFSRLIYKAVYAAMNRAWNEPYHKEDK